MNGKIDPGEMGVSYKVKPEGQSWLSGKRLETWNRWKDRIPIGEQYDIDAALRFLQAHYETEKLTLEQWQAQNPRDFMTQSILEAVRHSRALGFPWMEPFPQEERMEIYRLLAAKGEAPPLEEEENAALWVERSTAWMQIQSQQPAEQQLYRAMRLRCGLIQRDIDHGNLMMLWYVQALHELEEMGADIQGILDF